MPNGDFVKKNKILDENTKIMEPIKYTDVKEELENKMVTEEN